MTEQASDEKGMESSRIECGKLLNIAGTAELQKNLIDSINNNSEITIDITDPERIDTAGIQLLYSLVREARSREINLSWSGEIPDQLRKTAALVGLEKDLDLPPQTAE